MAHLSRVYQRNVGFDIAYGARAASTSALRCSFAQRSARQQRHARRRSKARGIMGSAASSRAAPRRALLSCRNGARCLTLHQHRAILPRVSSAGSALPYAAPLRSANALVTLIAQRVCDALRAFCALGWRISAHRIASRRMWRSDSTACASSRDR